MFRVMLLTMVLMAAASTASASEVVTIKNATGGSYSIMAYNAATRAYYYLNGSLGSDSCAITVPNGYSCSLTVAVGKRVGTRNLYEERDPMNPIFDVTFKSTYVLELTRIGVGSSSKAMGSLNTKSSLNLFVDGSNEFKRQPPK